MYEVERNFFLTDAERERLLGGASFMSEKTIVDVYYDTPAYALTLRDLWLRNRDGHFELKLPMDMPRDSAVDQYEEIEDEAEIRTTLELQADGTMTSVLETNGFGPFCTCTTRRKTYVKEGLTIVIDHVSYLGSDRTFDTCEIELLVDERGRIPEAGDRINAFAVSNGLSLDRRPNGKVIEYLIREKPEHLNALLKGGVTRIFPNANGG